MLLRYRLDKAYEYAAEHPDLLFVTSGGQGRDEWIPEGQAMRDYLIEKGLPADRVLAENKSTSTEESFAFSLDILKEPWPWRTTGYLKLPHPAPCTLWLGCWI